MSRKVYVIRHAEKNDLGTLTDLGRSQATQLKIKLPKFSIITSSESKRVFETAYLLTGFEPKIDPRAGFYMATPEKSDLLNIISKSDGSSFLEAAIKLNYPEVLAGIEAKGKELNNLIDENLNTINYGESALIVSHDLSISPAMQQRGVPLESIPFLSGYIIDENGDIQVFNRN